MKLLHRLASDRAIVKIMEENRWRVGKLSEMAPKGIVGEDPVCILGLNINQVKAVAETFGDLVVRVIV